jgi:transketolase
MRLNKSGEERIHEGLSLLDGPCAIEIREGQGTVVLTTGAILSEAKHFVEQCGLEWGIVSCPFVKPTDFKTIERLCHKYKRIITLEEHQLSCGFGSSVLEAINELQERTIISTAPRVTRIGIPDKFIHIAGTQEYLRKMMGLDLSLADEESTAGSYSLGE